MMCDVVFFKRKTEYELRISDWSSDVCSSDLVTIGSGHALMMAPSARTRRIGAAVGSGNSLRSHRGLLGGLQGVGGRWSGHGVVGRTRKIGRAPCRERVCQYV